MNLREQSGLQKEIPSILDLWKDNPKRIVSSDTILPLLSLSFEKAYEPLWEKETPLSSRTKWYKKRRKGLKAYAAYEADFRLRQFHKRDFTVDDFMEFHLHDVLTDTGIKALADPYFKNFLDYMRRNPTADFYIRLAQKIQSVGKDPNWHLKVYAKLYDCAEPPMEFWTNAASAAYLGFYYEKANRQETFTRDQIKMWKKLLKLKETKPFIIFKFDAVTEKFGFTKSYLQAIKKHGVPRPTPSELVR